MHSNEDYREEDVPETLEGTPLSQLFALPTTFQSKEDFLDFFQQHSITRLQSIQNPLAAPHIRIGRRDGDLVDFWGSRGGGMGRVYFGFSPAIPGMVAVKTILQRNEQQIHEDASVGPDHDTQMQTRFEREAGFLRDQGTNRYFPQFYGFVRYRPSTLDRIPEDYLVFEFIPPGVNAQEFVELWLSKLNILKPQQKIEFAAAVGLQVCAATASAHQAGIIFRDIKPANIAMQRPTRHGFVRLLDGGIVYEKKQAPITNPGQIVGSADTMAPEIAQGKTKGDPASDVYSLGCTLWRFVDERFPFVNENPLEIIRKHIHEPPPLLRLSGNRIDRKFIVLLGDALEKNPAQRPTLAEMMQALREIVCRSEYAPWVGPIINDPRSLRFG